MDFDLLGMGLGTDAAMCDLVRSEQLDRRLGLPEGTVARQSGVHERFVVKPGIGQAAFAAQALRRAAADAACSLEDLDLLLAASAVPQQAIPTTASFIAHELGLSGVAAFDINASCLGFLVGLHQAACLLQSGAYGRIGLAASDVASVGVDWRDVHTASIFGDGAAAVLLQRAKGALPDGALRLSCLAFALETYPEGRHWCEIRAGGTRANATVGMRDEDFWFAMDGRAVFRLAMQHTERFVDGLLARAGLEHGDIDCVVMHQASHLSVKHALSRLNFRAATAVAIYETHGNQVSASIPTVLYHAYRQGRLKAGSRLALLGTAAGFAIGGMIVQVAG